MSLFDWWWDSFNFAQFGVCFVYLFKHDKFQFEGLFLCGGSDKGFYFPPDGVFN